MWRLFAIATVCGISLSLSACSNGDTKKDGKKKDDQAAAKKDDKHKDGDHEHGKEGKHNDEDDHSPSDEPLVIVDDVVAASDGHAKEIFANDHARVVAVELHKGESLPLHKGGPRVVYAETALKFKFIEVHGDHTHAHADDHAAGTVHSHGAGPHGVENLADGDAKFVIFLRKEGDKKFTASVPEDAKTLSESTEHATKLLSNDDFRSDQSRAKIRPEDREALRIESADLCPERWHSGPTPKPTTRRTNTSWSLARPLFTKLVCERSRIPAMAISRFL